MNRIINDLGYCVILAGVVWITGAQASTGALPSENPGEVYRQPDHQRPIVETKGIGLPDYSIQVHAVVLDATPTPDPQITCPPGGVLEGEPDCGPDYIDGFNGGCGSTPPVFQAISCGDVICGVGGTFLSGSEENWDTDWYRLESLNPSVIRWTIEAAFPVSTLIIDAGTENCMDYQVVASAFGEPYASVEVVAEATPGVYWLWVGPSASSGYDCPLPYVAAVVCEPLVLVPATTPGSNLALLMTLTLLILASAGHARMRR